jgi:TDG/mug DNA glycosylase family protein
MTNVSNDILPDVLRDNLKIIFCGTAAGNTSARLGAYYAHPLNRFWHILHATKLTPTLLKPEEFSRLGQFGFGLTDLCKFASGNDDELPIAAVNCERLRSTIEQFRPEFLAFTSKTAGKAMFGHRVAFGFQGTIGPTNVYVLPTTSPRVGNKWWDDNRRHWHDFANQVMRNNQVAIRAHIS